MTPAVLVPANAGEIASSSPLRSTSVLSDSQYNAIRTQMVLEGCKWDPQVGDTEVIARFALRLTRHDWDCLRSHAEILACELMEAEAALAARPELFATLGVHHQLIPLLQKHAGALVSQRTPRILRFDFHHTCEGWRISEVNSDVPGGFSEASILPQHFAPYFPQLQPADDVAALWCDAIAEASQGGHVALLSATGYMEDQQIVQFLHGHLTRRGVLSSVISPAQLACSHDQLQQCGPTGSTAIKLLVRFYQAEWLPQLPRQSNWRNMFSPSHTIVVNSLTSVLTESKRFPLVWDKLGVRVPRWRELLPDTRETRDAPWQMDDTWLLKAAYSNTGDHVVSLPHLDPLAQKRYITCVRRNPQQWVAQKRFKVLPVASPQGEVFPCIGVYVLNGKAAGIYGRASSSPVINYSSQDVAVLIENESSTL